MVAITPGTGIIEALRKQSLPWSIILGELIDNAFDAGAHRVRIAFDRSRLEVQDDGVGCDNLLLFLTIGEREQKKTTQLGRYGIGAKDAAISAADSLEIRSVCRGVQRLVRCDWRRLERQHSWEIDEPTEAPTAEPSGTTLVFSPLRTERLKCPDDLINRLSLMYTPAIRAGRQILFRGSSRGREAPIPEYTFPPLEHQITADLDVFGKKARVTMGLVPDGYPLKENGLIISYGYRVIRPDGQRLGMGDDPTPGLFGWLELGAGWELTKNKDNVTGNLTALDAAIYEACKEVVLLAARRSQSVAFRGLEEQINSVLDDIVGNSQKHRRKARRSEGELVGTVERKTTGRRHTRARISQPGDTFDEVMGGCAGVKISFEHMGVDGPAARYQSGIRGDVIALNKDIPFLRAAASDRRAVACHAVYAAAAYFVIKRHEPFLEFMKDCQTDFEKISQVAGVLLSRLDADSMVTVEGLAS